MAPSPLVSVLIRSAGRPYLFEALRSVIDQTHANLSIWVLDVTGQHQVKIPDEYLSRVHLLISDAPLARAAAANRLLRHAEGEFALFLDDDDWLAPDHIFKLVVALGKASDAVLAYGDVSSVIADPASPGGWQELKRFDHSFNEARLLVENYIPIHAAVFRLDRTRDAGITFDEAFDLFEDWDFWLSCVQMGRFLRVPQVSAFYRVHGSAGTGVQLTDEAYAVQALDALLAKWRQRWTAEQLRALVGLTRHVFKLQSNENNLLNEIQKNREKYLQDLQYGDAERIRLFQEIQRAGEERLRLLDELHRAAEERVRLSDEQQRVEVERLRLCEELKRAEGERRQMAVDYENSRSWRITQPLRIAATLARALMRTPRQVVENGRQQLSRALLRWATSAYRSVWLRPVVDLIPFSVKRAVRNALMHRAHAGREPDIQTGELAPLTGTEPGLVSIVIPVYNHAQYLGQCLSSALSQSWPNVEVVVVDDASPDPRVAEVLAGFEGHPRLRLLKHDRNQGICQAQNSALMASKGEFIAFLDCDDHLATEAIEVCMRAWRDDTVYLHTGRINIDEQGNELSRIHFESLPRQDYFQENLRAMYATHLKLIKRAAFARVGLFDPRFDSAQDYEMLMRIAFHFPSSAFVHVSDFVYFHRIHPGQTTETQRAKQDQLTRIIQNEARMREGIRQGRYTRMLSFIMLSYGKHSQTLKAIEGLKATVKVPHEIILYDNGSVPETVDFLRQHIDGRFEGVKVYYGDRNLGPAQGRRVALEKASGEWFIIFDNDEVPEPGWIEELLLRAEANPDAGAVCCRVVFPDGKLQFSGGRVDFKDPADTVIDLALYDRGHPWSELAACVFRDVDWCPIGATLFTENIAPYLHDGYPNTFEDAGVSFALKKKGRRLLNAPGALVWHEHITFQPKTEMAGQYMKDRYNPRLMLKSIYSFWSENGLLIHDEYIWRENGLDQLSREQLLQRLQAAGAKATEF